MARETTIERRPRRPAPRSARQQSSRALSPLWLTVGALALSAVVVAALVFMSGRGGSGAALSTLRTPDFHALAFSPADPNLVFFGHHNGLKRSEDGGQTWQDVVNRPNFDAMGLAVNSTDPRRIYLAGHDIFQLSTDGGQTWEPVVHNLPGTDIHGFALNPASNHLFAYVVGQGVFQSTDGKTWQRLEGQIPNEVMALAAAGSAPETLYAGSMSAGVLRSTDGGQGWTPANNGLGSRNILALAVDPTADQTVYAGTDEGLYKSTDGAATWVKLPFPGSNAATLAVSPAQPGRVLVITVKDRQGLVHRSDDGGATWGTGQ